MTQHAFTAVILRILSDHFGELAEEVFDRSELLQYLNVKTRSANRGSKARSSFANHYAIYVLVEDYRGKGFADSGAYSTYEGARFTDLFKRQRELPFGDKLQNHALNSRLNEEFRKYFPTSEFTPVLRDLGTSRYWFSEGLLVVKTSRGDVNIAGAVIDVIDAYIATKRDTFETFIAQCMRLQSLPEEESGQVVQFIESLLEPNVDARIFEIVSFAVLKAYYGSRSVWFGWEEDSVSEFALVLFKTGRTNANDGGIDFVMRPLGRFFQVTESLEMRKYFLDIDKVQRFPITFVVKTDESPESIRRRIEEHARRLYTAEAIVQRYMEAIEEVVDIPILRERLADAVDRGNSHEIVEEVALQARVEFNLPDDDDELVEADAAGP